jgi:hypothetical protein
MAAWRSRATRAPKLLAVPGHDLAALDGHVGFHDAMVRERGERVCVLQRIAAGESSRMAV